MTPLREESPESDHAKPRFTGVVVTLDEERHLSKCLAALSFCDELLVIDIGSRDACVAIAEAAGARVVRHERVAIVELLREKAARMARNDWIVFTDPDEVQPDGLADALRRLIAADTALGLVGVRSQFYFRGRKLTTTAWGMRMPKFYVCHRDRVRFSPDVHVGLEPTAGHTKALVSEPLELAHYWMDDWEQLRAKHRRYLTVEGEAMHRGGARFSWGRLAYRTLGSLKRNLLNNRALLGGLIGIRLSLFHARYTAGRWLSLRRYEKQQQRYERQRTRYERQHTRSEQQAPATTAAIGTGAGRPTPPGSGPTDDGSTPPR